LEETFLLHGKADIVVHKVGEQHRVDYYHQSPMRIFLPALRQDQKEVEIVLANTSGGLVGGDEMQIDLTIESGAASVVTSQAAEKAYGSKAADTLISTTVRIHAGSRLRWIPQETILFDGVRLRRKIALDVHSTATAMAGEMLVFGRHASGESLTHGLVHDEWLVRVDGKLVWADNMHLTGDIARQTNSPAGFGGSKAMATLVYVSDDAAERLDCVKSLVRSQTCKTGATLIGNMVIARWLGKDATQVRRAYGRFLEAFSAELDYVDSRIPAVWGM
jgi:urease accessory protein